MYSLAKPYVDLQLTVSTGAQPVEKGAATKLMVDVSV